MGRYGGACSRAQQYRPQLDQLDAELEERALGRVFLGSNFWRVLFFTTSREKRQENTRCCIGIYYQYSAGVFFAVLFRDREFLEADARKEK